MASSGRSHLLNEMFRPQWRRRARDRGHDFSRRLELPSAVHCLQAGRRHVSLPRKFLTPPLARVRSLDVHAREGLEERAIMLRETIAHRAIDVEDADDARPRKERHDDLGLRCGIAGDVAGKRVHVRHDERLAPRPCRPTHAFAEPDAHARGFALERPEHELVTADEVEAAPIELRQRRVDQRREVRGVGDRIALAVDERPRLQRESSRARGSRRFRSTPRQLCLGPL